MDEIKALRKKISNLIDQFNLSVTTYLDDVSGITSDEWIEINQFYTSGDNSQMSEDLLIIPDKLRPAIETDLIPGNIGYIATKTDGELCIDAIICFDILSKHYEGILKDLWVGDEL